ncbi:hypothetical protein GCM10009839_84340 [Catenulispora yoronensis]|uniref:Integral membrane protein n=1 Tax=Catenulispora yoronensis TaxID=450799 RepID=A0ABN2VF36_9ACTN
MTDLLDFSDRRRPKNYVTLRVFTVLAAVVAVPFTIVAAVCAVLLFPSQADQEAYDKAPICAAGVTSTHDCALQTTAQVEYVDSWKNTGKNAHGYTTKADLVPVAGKRESITVSKSRDLTSEISVGDTWPVLVWRDVITRYTFDGTTHDADKNPHKIVVQFLIATPACLAVAAFFGRAFIRRVIPMRVANNPARHRIPEWTLLVLCAATVVAASVHASYVASVFALLGVTALIGSVAVWPFLPWVLESDPGSVLGRGQTQRAMQRYSPRRLP